MFDIIGDVHGHADELEELLEALGYNRGRGCPRHPSRRAVFVGDVIDRGPKVREALTIVRDMVEGGAALAVLGNHEFNALCYHASDGNGGHLRPHTQKNVDQHRATLEAFAGAEGEWREHLDWFRTLPLILELDGCRIVHGCGHPERVEEARATIPASPIDDGFLRRSSTRGTPDHQVVEDVLKGIEIPLPAGVTFRDEEGHERQDARIRWWADPLGKTYAEYGLGCAAVPDPLPAGGVGLLAPYPADAPPVFFGHYWLSGQPTLQTENVCCLDYSVAKGGCLAAYRWDGEQVLDGSRFVAVPARNGAN